MALPPPCVRTAADCALRPLTNGRRCACQGRRCSLTHATPCSDLCHDMSKAFGGKDYFQKTTGLPISTYFSAFKVAWLYAHVAAVREAMDGGDAMIGTVDSWIAYNLTGATKGGVHVTDGAVRTRACCDDRRQCREGCCVGLIRCAWAAHEPCIAARLASPAAAREREASSRAQSPTLRARA